MPRVRRRGQSNRRRRQAKSEYNPTSFPDAVSNRNSYDPRRKDARNQNPSGRGHHHNNQQDTDSDGDLQMENLPLTSPRHAQRNRRDHTTYRRNSLERYTAVQRPVCPSCDGIAAANRELRSKMLSLAARQQRMLNEWAEAVAAAELALELMDWRPEAAVPVHIITSIKECESYYDAVLNYPGGAAPPAALKTHSPLQMASPRVETDEVVSVAVYLSSPPVLQRFPIESVDPGGSADWNSAWDQT